MFVVKLPHKTLTTPILNSLTFWEILRWISRVYIDGVLKSLQEINLPYNVRKRLKSKKNVFKNQAGKCIRMEYNN